LPDGRGGKRRKRHKTSNAKKKSPGAKRRPRALPVGRKQKGNEADLNRAKRGGKMNKKEENPGKRLWENDEKECCRSCYSKRKKGRGNKKFKSTGGGRAEFPLLPL